MDLQQLGQLSYSDDPATTVLSSGEHQWQRGEVVNHDIHLSSGQDQRQREQRVTNHMAVWLLAQVGNVTRPVLRRITSRQSASITASHVVWSFLWNFLQQLLSTDHGTVESPSAR